MSIETGHSVQDHEITVGSQVSNMIVGEAGLARLLQMQMTGTLERAPAYWSKSRDEWLVDFVHAEGNDLLAGAVSTVTAKVVANSWYVEGPLLLAGMARDQLLYWSAFGRGWNYLMSPMVEGFLVRDMGGVTELHRASRSDITGPAMGYSHLDESRLTPTGDPEYPFIYSPAVGKGDFIKMNRAWVAHIVDMPSGQRALRGVGYCSVSRCITIALTLQQVAKYKRERLSDLPPAALMLLNNLGEEEWDDLTANYDGRMQNQGNTVWRNVMVAFGVDPAYPLAADLLEFSKLPEHFDEKDFTEMTVYSFALAFREDPREFWPVSSGPLGTATEAELQARSARLKGEGIICNAIERQLNRSECLPPEVVFHFDYQDDEADLLAAGLKDIQSTTIRRFWEPSPGSTRFGGPGGGPSTGPDGTSEGGGVLAEPGQEQVAVGAVMPEPHGIITTEEARQWALRERIIPWDILAQPIDVDRIYDTKSWRAYKGFGPRVRLYRDGLCYTMERHGGVRWRS